MAEASRMLHLPDKEQIQYLFAMVSEHEKLDIGTAYYKDGFEEGQIKTAKQLIAQYGLNPEDVAKLIGVKKEELQ